MVCSRTPEQQLWENQLRPPYSKHCQNRRHKPSSPHVLQTSNDGVLAELHVHVGRFPLEVELKLAVIKYWLRLIELDQHHILHKTYELSKMIDAKGVYSWVTCVKKILEAN